MHNNGHTQVPRVGSCAKLGEGSTQSVSVCEGVNLAPFFEGHKVNEPDLIVVMNRQIKGVIVGHHQGTLVTITAVKPSMGFNVN